MRNASGPTTPAMVPFLTLADTTCITGDLNVPSLAIHPDATPQTLLGIAEARLGQLDTLLSILECANPAITVPVSEVTCVIRAQVEAVRLLVEQANERSRKEH